MKKKIIFLALSLCIGFGPATFAQGSSQTASSPAQTTTQLQTKTQPLSERQLQGIVAALASYHDVDASFSEAVRLAGLGTSGAPMAALSGSPTGSLSNLNDADDSDAATAPRPQPQGPELAGNQGDSGFRYLDVAPPADASDNPLIGLGYDFAEDGSGQNLNRRDYSDSQVVLPGTLTDADDSDSLGTLNDTGVLMAALDFSSSPESRLFSLPTNGSLDAQHFADQLVKRIEADRGILVLNALELSPEDFKHEQVPSGQLIRLGQRSFTTSAGFLDPLNSDDGSRYNLFSTHFMGSNGAREVLLTSEVGSPNGTGLDMLLSDRSEALSGIAYRASEALADGGLRLTTSVIDDISGGGALEILEERLLDAKGQGQGLGLFQMRTEQEIIATGTLRTISGTDGSLLTYLDLDQGPALVIQEDASGKTRMAWLKSDVNSAAKGENIDWKSLNISSFSSEMRNVFE